MTGAGRGFSFLAVAALIAGFVAAGPEATTAVSSGPSQGDGTELVLAPGEEVPGEIDPVTGAVGPVSGDPAKQAIHNKTVAGLECAPGKNGDSTDVGVTGTKIKIASTVVLDGPAASLLSSSPAAMQAVINKVNRAGGVCGRQLELTAVNDSFDAQRGGDFLRSFVESKKYFALPVVPSAEGLSTAILAKTMSSSGTPVVGSDGMRIEQYNDPWVWPVATATASTMRIMARYGAEKQGAKTFAIVWDNRYKFGVEGAEAFKKEVQRLGGELKADVGLNPAQPSYSNEAASFNGLCGGGKCDMVALLLLPDAARTWMAAKPQKAAKYTAAAQTLFSDTFAQQCVQVAKEDCHGIAVWTGFNPPIGSAASSPGMATYISDVTAVDPKIDVRNQFVEGAYLGMSLFVEALRKVGPNLTRDALKQTLDSMTFETELAPPLTWRSGKHHANGRARAFSVVVSQGTFTGWRDELTGFVADSALEGKQ